MEFQPRYDLISKIILTDERVINVISKSIIDAPDNSYINVPTKIIKKDICHVLYISRETQHHLPPILVNTVEYLKPTDVFEIIQTCADTFEEYALSVCLIITTQQLNETHTENRSPFQKILFLREIPSKLWAKQCLLISSKDYIDGKLMKHPLLEIIIAIICSKKVVLSTE